MRTLPPMRVAVVHEWVDSLSGSEKTFAEIAKVFPGADLFALTVNPAAIDLISDRSISTTILQTFDPKGLRRAFSLPLMPLAWKMMKHEEYDVVVSSSHAFARYFNSRDSSAKHFSYVHTPLRYAWYPEIDGRGSGRLSKPARSILRQLDLHSSRSVTTFAANSQTVADRIRACYSRESRVIYPPVDTEFFTPDPSTSRGEHLLAVSRFVPYKRLDLAIQLAEKMRLPLMLAGSGPDEARLRRLADSSSYPVEFAISPTNDELRHYYRTARALVFLANEDFGIIPVEAQACGTPVLGIGVGGVSETVLDRETGILLPADDPLSGAATAGSWLDEQRSACSDAVENAARFSSGRFQRDIREWVGENS